MFYYFAKISVFNFKSIRFKTMESNHVKILFRTTWAVTLLKWKQIYGSVICKWCVLSKYLQYIKTHQIRAVSIGVIFDPDILAIIHSTVEKSCFEKLFIYGGLFVWVSKSNLFYILSVSLIYTFKIFRHYMWPPTAPMFLVVHMLNIGQEFNQEKLIQ